MTTATGRSGQVSRQSRQPKTGVPRSKYTVRLLIHGTEQAEAEVATVTEAKR